MQTDVFSAADSRRLLVFGDVKTFNSALLELGRGGFSAAHACQVRPTC